MEGQVRISSHPLPGTADEGTRSIRVRDGVHLFITPPEQLSALEHARLGHLCTTWTQAQSGYQLTQRFQTLFKCGGVAEFRVWLTEARQGDIREFKRLARGLSHDQKAVEASLTVPWSNGQVEGQVNRLKLIKRQHYGRAGFELLRRRVIGAGRLRAAQRIDMTPPSTCT